MTDSDITIAPRGRGRPRKDAARSTHAPTREPSRSGLEVLGRNGEVLSRSRPAGAKDQFDFPAHLKEPGWDYQWIASAIFGNGQLTRNTNVQMQMNGWRPCASKKIAEFYGLNAGVTVTVDDLVLHERPLALSQEARAEDIRNAKQLISDRNQSLKLSGVKNSMPDGFAMNSNRYRGTGGDVRMSIDPGLDIAPSGHQLAEPGE